MTNREVEIKKALKPKDKVPWYTALNILSKTIIIKSIMANKLTFLSKEVVFMRFKFFEFWDKRVSSPVAMTMATISLLLIEQPAQTQLSCVMASLLGLPLSSLMFK